MERDGTPNPMNTQMANGLNHAQWQNSTNNQYNNCNTPEQTPTRNHQNPQQGSMNYYPTWTTSAQHVYTTQQTSMAAGRFASQTTTVDSNRSQIPSPGYQGGDRNGGNWLGQGHHLRAVELKTEPLSPPPYSPPAQNNQEGMSAASIAAGRKNGKMNSQAPIVNDSPWVQITEQPKSRGLRFRYECEGRSAGSIPGERSQIERKSFPAVKINNYQGTAVVVVSCVTKDNPPKPHPHSLVGKGCDKGVYTQKIKSHDMVASFPHLGIQCAKRKDVEGALKQRETIRVDPFSTGFKHKANQIDLNVVRLCFQVFLPDGSGRFTRIVAPVVSNPIFDKKAAGDLVICRLDKHAGSVRGGEEVFLLCEKVNKDDIKVKFYEEDEDGLATWEAWGEFGASDVHRQFAIVFKTPAYRSRVINGPVNVFLQLLRPSDEETSEPKQFMYKPEDHDPEFINAKKKRKVAAMDPLFDLAAIPSTVPVDPSTGDADMMDVSHPTVKERVKLKASRNIQTKKEAPDHVQSSSAAVGSYPVYDMGGTTDAALQQYGTTYQLQAPPGSGDMYYTLEGDAQPGGYMTHQQILDSLSSGGIEQINSSDSAELRRYVQENFPSMTGMEGEVNLLPGSLLTSLEPLDVAANVSVGDEQSPQLHMLQTVPTPKT